MENFLKIWKFFENLKIFWNFENFEKFSNFFQILLNFNQLQFLGFLRYTNDQVLKKHLRDHSNPMRCMKSLCAQLRARYAWS